MKKQFLILCLCAASTVVAPAAVTINLTGGIFASNDGVHSPLANGQLIQLIASRSDSDFSTPTAASFVSGDDVVIGSGMVDSSILSVNGSAQFSILVDFASFPGLGAGDPLLLRWFDINAAESAPGTGAAYGEFRTDSSVDGGDPWLMIGDGGGLITLTLASESAGGSQPDSAGYTLLAVPEPSSSAILLGALGAVAFRRRRA
ncbi:MAG: PEP-CTERM sorting domain-containing protein [Luteolibacter sp.]